LAQASGAYFLTVVTTQSVNAFLCRSSTLTLRHLGLTSNRMLLVSVLIEFVAAMAMLLLPQLNQALGQDTPPAVGWAMALAAPAVLLLVDAADKAARRGRYEASTPLSGTAPDLASR
jgi:MFS-type transporter involved in bile tolerance (Atg22 family)